MGSVSAQTFNASSESVIEVEIPQNDSAMTHICGDLHQLTETLQQNYLAFKQGSHNNYKLMSDYDPQAVHNCGSFTIIYADIDQNNGGGYDDSILGEARRNTFCAVLNYVEDILYVHPDANPVIFVDASYSQTNPAPLGTGFLAQAGSYLSGEPNHTYGVDPGIYDGLFAEYIQTGVDPDPSSDLDGYLQTNFDGINTTSYSPISYFNLGDPLVSTKKYDLFSTLLHEVTHILGFASSMGENISGNLACKNPGNSFRRFDLLYGYYGDILNPATFSGKKLLVGTEANPVINPNVNTIPFPLRRARVWINNQGSPNNHLLFSGNPSTNSNVDFINQGHGSILSHFGGDYIFPTRQQFSPGKYVNYVMNYSISTEEIRRQWTLPEIRMLLGLGYTINPVFAAATTLSPPNSNTQVIANSPPYRSDYNVALDFLSYNYFEPIVDHLSFPENRNSNFSIVNSNTNAAPSTSTLSMDISVDNTLVDNDGDVISVLPETVFGIRGVSNGGNNHDRLQLDASGTNFTYTPEPGYYGRAEFGFQLWDGKELGAIEVYTIEVVQDPNITYGANEEMVINGSFEDGTEARTWENPEKSYTTKNSYFQPNLHFGLLHSGGHPYGMMGTGPTGGNVLLHSLDDLNGLGPSSEFGYYGYYFNSCPWGHIPSPSTTEPNNTRYFAYSLGTKQVSTLKFSMVPGENYILEFELAFPDQSNTGNIFDVGDVLTDYVINIIDEPTDIENLEVFQTLNPVITVNTLTQGGNPSAWQTISVPFKYCGNQEANYISFERVFTAGELNYVTLLDNISLKINPNPAPLSVDAGEDQYINPDCAGAQFQPTITNLVCDMTYSWAPTTGISDPTILNPVANPSQTTTYTITVTDALTNETATDQVTVYVIPMFSTFENLDVCDEGIIDLYDLVEPDGGQFFAQTGLPTIIDDHFFDPTIDGLGSYVFLYGYGSVDCPLYGSFTINVLGINSSNATHPNGLTVINGSTDDGATLTGSFQFLEDLIIEDDAVFTFSNADVQFAEGKGIHIEPGGRLNINNSTLTNLVCEGTNWNGIRVGGYPALSQYGANFANQGRCFIDHSTIENAIIGITNYDMINQRGGIIRTMYSTFKNCRRAVHHLSYNNYHPTGASIDVSSSFYNSEFLWNEDFQFINDFNNPMVDLLGVRGVLFSGCDFINTHPGLFTYPNNSFQKAAILCRTKASINMQRGCNGAPPYLMTEYGCDAGDETSIIKGFNYGVVLRYGASPSSIRQTNFNCYRGLWTTSENSLRLTRNNFGELPPNLLALAGGTDPNDPAWGITYGAYLDYSTMYWVEGNTFNFPNTNLCAGLIARASGGAYNEVNDNNFNNIDYGILAYDNNRGVSPYSGLKLYCNSFNHLSNNILVFPTISNAPSGWGISHWQGMPQIIQGWGFTAGNHFANTAYYDVFNVLENVTYFFHPSENLTSTIGVTWDYNNDANSCVSSFPSPYGFGKEAEAATHKASADSISGELALVIDDGDTQQLTNEVILADYGEAVELYYDLMEVSPNLSEEVMIEAINKETELPAVLLALILKSNPHAAKSGKLQEELDERSQPLAEYQRAMINEGLDLVTYKEGLEARKAYHEGRYNALLNQLIIETMADTTVLDKVDAIENLIAGYETVDHYYMIIDLLLADGNVSAAQTKLYSIATDFNLDPRRDAEYVDFIDVYSILFNKMNSGNTTLTSSEYDQLMIIAYRHSTLAAGLALVLLEQYADQPFLEVLVQPNLQGKSNRLNGKEVKQPKITLCKVYPNPTSGILIVEISTEFQMVKAQLTDVAGRTVLQQDELQGIATLNMRHLAPGSYILQLESENGILRETHQIQLAK